MVSIDRDESNSKIVSEDWSRGRATLIELPRYQFPEGDVQLQLASLGGLGHFQGRAAAASWS
jgi:hypothetical protein